MKKVLFPILALVMALGLSLPALAADPVSTTVVDLIMDGGDTCTDIGDVTIDYYDDGTFTVIYNITGSGIISLDETHVYLALDPPMKHSPGKFLYMAGEVIDLGVVGVGDIVYIAAHAEVTWDTGEVDIDQNPIYESESGWAQSGDDTLIGKKKNWATYFEWVPIVL